MYAVIRVRGEINARRDDMVSGAVGGVEE